MNCQPNLTYLKAIITPNRYIHARHENVSRGGKGCQDVFQRWAVRKCPYEVTLKPLKNTVRSRDVVCILESRWHRSRLPSSLLIFSIFPPFLDVDFSKIIQSGHMPGMPPLTKICLYDQITQLDSLCVLYV
jgi:hypothetical protein